MLRREPSRPAASASGHSRRQGARGPSGMTVLAITMAGIHKENVAFAVPHRSRCNGGIT